MSQNAPEKEFASGRIRAAIWRNEELRDGRKVVRFSIKIQKQYLEEKTGEWRDTTYYFPEELAKLELVVRKAFEYVSLRESDDDTDLPVVAR